MGSMDVIRARHSVRKYQNKPIEETTLARLRRTIDECSRESGLNIQLVQNNPEVFEVVARFGIIRGASDSIVFVADGTADDEKIGYWGQRIVLAAQEFGLNTCWAALVSRKRSKAIVPDGMAVRIVIAVGYGATQGNARKTKPVEDLCTIEGNAPLPAWFARGMEAAQLAPTAMNAQKFRITLRADGKTVLAQAGAKGWAAIDLGIVKRNFEEAACEESSDWSWG